MSHRIDAGSVDELAPGQRKLKFINGRSIVLFNIEGTIHAVDNACPHNGASLASGRLDGRVLRCPAHGLPFDLATGAMPGNAGLSLTTFPVFIVDGRLELSLQPPSETCRGFACRESLDRQTDTDPQPQ
ncbi:Rieske (2Fe-2S) domain protein [Paraburkholderia piptadeniae]|uniref:Rieske (2Fe-2S) domain protein n=1 Tax=Paraburkholderia piptadeniae TaxID=1701573 RepID=A0A1N7SQ50_9BURK|nr:Rieske 2Fe-2S domain-containing protein [Paraburkholderia piptadeniae]SIT49583.1 Rieske (2Fe-2S) domain protein [Paraburkholderia piptadeniae]